MNTTVSKKTRVHIILATPLFFVGNYIVSPMNWFPYSTSAFGLSIISPLVYILIISFFILRSHVGGWFILTITASLALLSSILSMITMFTMLMGAGNSNWGGLLSYVMVSAPVIVNILTLRILFAKKVFSEVKETGLRLRSPLRPKTKAMLIAMGLVTSLTASRYSLFNLNFSSFVLLLPILLPVAIISFLAVRNYSAAYYFVIVQLIQSIISALGTTTMLFNSGYFIQYMILESIQIAIIFLCAFYLTRKPMLHAFHLIGPKSELNASSPAVTPK